MSSLEPLFVIRRLLAVEGWNVLGDTGTMAKACLFVLGAFCLKQHDSTVGLKSQTDPTLDRQVLFFVLARGGCGRGASALPLYAS
jgi:hypothetical protein